MHKIEYRQLIDEAAKALGIETTHFSDNWAINLTKNNVTKSIIGYTFPLNDAACYKIARNKNLCSEVLERSSIPNVPHQLLFNPTILEKRNSTKGNQAIIQQFIQEYGYPFLIKKNNSSGGEGVFLIETEPQLENILNKVFLTDITICLSPFRKNAREFRNVVLNGECLLSYEKLIPYVIADGKSTILELVTNFQKEHIEGVLKNEKFLDESIIKRLNEVSPANEKILLQWKHNTSFGTVCEIIDDEKIKVLAIAAAKAINAKFVSVDIILSETNGLEVLEINASVVLQLFAKMSSTNREIALKIFIKALEVCFD